MRPSLSGWVEEQSQPLSALATGTASMRPSLSGWVEDVLEHRFIAQVAVLASMRPSLSGWVEAPSAYPPVPEDSDASMRPSLSGWVEADVVPWCPLRTGCFNEAQPLGLGGGVPPQARPPRQAPGFNEAQPLGLGGGGWLARVPRMPELPLQ